MTSYFTPDTDKKLHPALNALDERQIAAIYQAFQVAQLQPGECVFSEGEENTNTYLLISGSLRIQQMRQDVIYPVTRIEWPGQVTDTMFSEHGVRTATAIAREPVSVMRIDQAGLNSLDADVQAALLKNLQKDLSEEINALYVSQADALFKNTHLSQELNALLLGKSSQYSSSAAIQGMLKRVPKLPPYASQLTGMLLSEDVSAKDVTELAKLDPSLTGAVLKSVNSAYYGLTQKVTDFQHAALLLGFNQIYQVILSLGIQKTMPDTGQFKRLQAHCVSISILAFEISQVTGAAKGPVMNTIGLLHDIGKSVLLLLISQNPKLAFFISLLDHARISALLLENWEIPEDIYGPLEFQRYPELLPPDMIPHEFRKQVSILYLSHLCQDFIAGKTGVGLTSVFLEDYMKEIGIKEKNVEDFIRNSLAPSIRKRIKTYPVDVQESFSAILEAND